MAAKKPPREIPFEQIEQRFTLIGFHWVDGEWKPAVFAKESPTSFGIRVLRSRNVSRTGKISDSYDYFELDADGIVTRAPRGYAHDHKGARIAGIREAVERYATPDPRAPRLTL